MKVVIICITILSFLFRTKKSIALLVIGKMITTKKYEETRLVKCRSTAEKQDFVCLCHDRKTAINRTEKAIRLHNRNAGGINSHH